MQTRITGPAPHFDANRVKLGKRRPRFNDRTPRIKNFLSQGLPPAPAKLPLPANMAVNYPWGMALNDTEGDCTIATPKHMIELWSDGQTVVPDSAVQDAYIAVTGSEGAAYDPATGANDNGCVIADVLAYWKSTGIGGDTIDAYGMVDYTDVELVKQCIHVFGSVSIGVQLPIAAQSQSVWTTNPNGGATGIYTPGSWGGHSIPLLKYTKGWVWCVTWGGILQMSWDWLLTYCDEAWAIVDNDYLRVNGKTPLGYDEQGLLKALASA